MRFARVAGEFDVFGCHDLVSLIWIGWDQAAESTARQAQPTMPRMSLSFMISRSSPSSLTSVPDHLPNRIRSPALTSSGVIVPSSARAPEPTATTSPSCGFSLAVSGMMMPPAVFSCGFDAADEHAIVQGAKCHGQLSSRWVATKSSLSQAGSQRCQSAIWHSQPECQASVMWAQRPGASGASG